ncbi:MAG: hypothetical protein V8R52_02145 [Coprobacter fastidiosus]
MQTAKAAFGEEIKREYPEQTFAVLRTELDCMTSLTLPIIPTPIARQFKEALANKLSNAKRNRATVLPTQMKSSKR